MYQCLLQATHQFRDHGAASELILNCASPAWRDPIYRHDLLRARASVGGVATRLRLHAVTSRPADCGTNIRQSEGGAGN